MVRIAQIAQAQANEAGFKVEVRQIDPTSLITVLRQRDFDLCMSPWSGRYDPDGNMFFYFTKGGPNNFPGYDDAEVTSWLAEARTATDPAARVRLYHQAQASWRRTRPCCSCTSTPSSRPAAPELSWTQYPDAVFRLYDARMS